MFKCRKAYWLDSQPQRVSSAAVILENNDGQALIVKANYKNYWTFPGGIIEPNETPKQGAVREVAEEIGIQLPLQSLTFVAIVDRVSSRAQTYQFVFKAQVSEEMLSQIHLQASEIDEHLLVSKQDVSNEIRAYSESVKNWARDESGYIEQLFQA
jgi:8-oxo-dGTP diphosphatase